MHFFIYLLCLPFIYFIVYMPFPLLYKFSDLIGFLLYRVFSYRKKVVFGNLQNSFPEKSPQEIRLIARKFYSYFADMVLESLKAIGMTEAQVLQRCKIMNPEVCNQFFEKNQNVVIITGHYGNTEWAGESMSLTVKHALFLTYAPFSNPYLDRLVNKTRIKFGSTMVPVQDTLRIMIENKNNEALNYGILFSADQMPHPEKVYWTTFLNQETAVYWGPEKIASKFNYPVIFGYIRRPARGKYEIYMELICENPKDTQEGDISEAHTKALESQIIQYPELWYWTHKRWKTHPWQQAYKEAFLKNKNR